MTSYTETFGGATIYPSDISYSSISVAVSSQTLSWPNETSSTGPYATRIIDVTGTNSATSITIIGGISDGNGFYDGNILNTTDVTGVIVTGMVLTGAPVSVYVVSQLTGTAGGVGTYLVSAITYLEAGTAMTGSMPVNYITLPDATKATVGETILFNCISGTKGAMIKNASGTSILVLSIGVLWQIYLADNSTSAGTWRIVQYGSNTGTANASTLAGYGLQMDSIGTNTLQPSVGLITFSSSISPAYYQRGSFFKSTASGAVNFTFPSNIFGFDNWFCYLRNNGTGIVTILPASGGTINGGVSQALNPGDSCMIIKSGTIKWETVGLGQSATFTFGYKSIVLPGTAAPYVLSGNELNQVSYKFTGSLTGTPAVTVPATIQQYWISNGTAASLKIQSSGGGTTYTIPTGQNSIVYCDGTNIIHADTASLTTPLTIAQGGTNATTAPAALTNLGGGATGISLFGAASTSAAWAVLGTVIGGTF